MTCLRKENERETGVWSGNNDYKRQRGRMQMYD